MQTDPSLLLLQQAALSSSILINRGLLPVDTSFDMSGINNAKTSASAFPPSPAVLEALRLSGINSPLWISGSNSSSFLRPRCRNDMPMLASNCATNPPIANSLPASDSWLASPENLKLLLDLSSSANAMQLQSNSAFTANMFNLSSAASCVRPAQPVDTLSKTTKMAEIAGQLSALIQLERENVALRGRLEKVETLLRQFEGPEACQAAPMPVEPAPAKARKPLPSFARGKDKSGGRFWSRKEHARFVEALRCCGTFDAHAIARAVGTRTVQQVRSHAQKYFLKLARMDGETSDDAASTASSASSHAPPAGPGQAS